MRIGVSDPRWGWSLKARISKSEIRNKQVQIQILKMKEIQQMQCNVSPLWSFCILVIWDCFGFRIFIGMVQVIRVLVIWDCFEFRYSDFGFIYRGCVSSPQNCGAMKPWPIHERVWKPLVRGQGDQRRIACMRHAKQGCLHIQRELRNRAKEISQCVLVHIRRICRGN
jgi:hypothetical protein